MPNRCEEATNHYPNQWWPRSLTPEDVNCPWVMSTCILFNINMKAHYKRHIDMLHVIFNSIDGPNINNFRKCVVRVLARDLAFFSSPLNLTVSVWIFITRAYHGWSCPVSIFDFCFTNSRQFYFILSLLTANSIIIEAEWHTYVSVN